ncbi:MAG: NYN domain-containing protein [Candidatus Thorarchaeota archaeon]
MWFTQLGWGAPVTGIFWDYENVPLRHTDWEDFLHGLRAYVNSNQVIFARVYVRKATLPIKDRELINALNIFDYKWIRKDDPNAADYSLIQSCLDVLKIHSQINHVLLVFGDADFLELTDQLHEWQVAISLICQSRNYSEDLRSEVHYAYSVHFVASHPQDWWLYR